MQLLVILPILVPLISATIMLMFWKRRILQRWLSVISALALFGVSVGLLYGVRVHGTTAVQLADWPAPFGISLVADLLSAIMVVTASLMGLAVAVFSLQNIDKRRESFFYYPLLHTLLMSVCGAHLTGDIFNLYVWFEVMLMSSFVLLALGGERPQLEGAIKYVTLNLISSAIFLAGVGILYGVAGTLNMADLAYRLSDVDNPKVVTTVSMLFFVAFGVKAALFPLFFWLPASYHTPPVAVSAIFAGLLTKVGVYAMIRIYTLIFNQEYEMTSGLLLLIAGLTMVIGVLGAAAQMEIRRLLAFHIISQIGYMIMGLGLAMALTYRGNHELAAFALAAGILHMIHNILAKSNLFLISGLIERMKGTFDLERIGGLYRSYPWLAVLFLISALALAGIPPLSGFFSKYMLIRAGVEAGHFVIVVAALGVGLLTLFSMMKIWGEAFWKDDPIHGTNRSSNERRLAHIPPWSKRGIGAMALPCIVIAALIVSFAVFAQPLVELLIDCSRELLDPFGETGYIRAVDQHGHILDDKESTP